MAYSNRRLPSWLFIVPTHPYSGKDKCRMDTLKPLIYLVTKLQLGNACQPSSAWLTFHLVTKLELNEIKLFRLPVPETTWDKQV
jgi:hypothetical protein